jgi:hypothetical protein
VARPADHAAEELTVLEFQRLARALGWMIGDMFERNGARFGCAAVAATVAR